MNYADHRTICRFDNKNGQQYLQVVEYLGRIHRQLLAAAASQTQQQRLQGDGRQNQPSSDVDDLQALPLPADTPSVGAVSDPNLLIPRIQGGNAIGGDAVSHQGQGGVIMGGKAVGGKAVSRRGGYVVGGAAVGGDASG